MIYIFISILAIIFAYFCYRKWHLYNDRILNPDNEPFLTFAEQERRRHHAHFPPWLTQDKALLEIASTYFSKIALPKPGQLKKPDLTPVKIVQLKKNEKKLTENSEPYFVAVGGPSAAMAAFQQAKNGERVLYVNKVDASKMTRPIWAGAANHIEHDVLTEEPASITGGTPFNFIFREALRFLNPLRYDSGVLKDDFPWLTLNFLEWIRHPQQWLSALRVAFSNKQIALSYEKTLANGQTSDAMQELTNRVQASCEYLKAFNRDYAKIIREPRGAMIIAADDEVWGTLLKDRELLEKSGRALNLINADEVQKKYGFVPRNAVGMMEKPDDFIFEPDFFETIVQEIKNKGGEVQTDWRLKRILVDPEEQGGVLEFIEDETKKLHYRKFSHAHLSLGSTLFNPNPYDLVSVTGVSINALVFGLKLFGGPFVCGGASNHIAVCPLLPPVKIQNQDVSFIRIAVGGCVNPLNRNAKRWYTYYGQTVVNALHCVRKTFPAEAHIKILSVIGCNRVIGADGRSKDVHPYIKAGSKKRMIESVTIQAGAAGAGLTQMAAMAALLSKQ